ncbi:MAG TPA: farnesyl diphosphate synthase [Pyrinomonadaceae bacterium]|nr:farnesyl diphosphate synthase [Pyrinomonadaceae bacterium]
MTIPTAAKTKKMPSEAHMQNTLELESLLAGNRALIEVELNTLLPSSATAPEKIHQAIRWSVFAGGKRFRPALLLATGQAFGSSIKSLLRTACAFEMVHTYSLIHDDLPAMDDDDLRRGRPTCHVRFDEATAILAGDALQTLAFQAIAEDHQLPAETRIRLISELTRAAATPDGMVAGQALDMEAETHQVNGAQLEEIHRLKTGALIVAAARCGAIIGGANEDEFAAITRYGSCLGLLFQITDDLLDVTATAEDLGKTPGKDARSNKATYPALFGIEETRASAIQAHRNACAALDQLDRPTDVLRRIADFILHRTG